jgi:hypothetical protein
MRIQDTGSAKALDDFAANGPAAAPAGDRFVIQINVGADTLRFSKSIKPDANDIDPTDIDALPQVAADDHVPVAATPKPSDRPRKNENDDAI